MNFKTIIVVMGMLLPFLSIKSQNVSKLNIGDIVPDISFTAIKNSRKQIFNLSDFKGKLVLLDFYGTWCSSCQPGISKLDSLQKLFKSQIQVIVLSHDQSIELVNRTINTRWKDQNIVLPFVLAGDNKAKINQLFPHKTIPHEIWIGKEGKLLALTNEEEVNYVNILSYLQGKNMHLTMKIDQMDFDPKKPLFSVEMKSNTSNLLYQSSIGKYLNGVGSINGIQYNATKNKTRKYFINASLIDLYLSATNYSKYATRILLETKDSNAFLRRNTPWNIWLPSATFCYEQYVPENTSDSLTAMHMLSDLNSYFPYYGRTEKRRVLCQILTRDKINLVASHSDSSYSTMSMHDNSIKRMKKKYISEFTNAITGRWEDRPLNPIIIDETAISYPVDMDLGIIDLSNITQVNMAIKSYGLSFHTEMRELEMLVISDKH